MYVYDTGKLNGKVHESKVRLSISRSAFNGATFLKSGYIFSEKFSDGNIHFILKLLPAHAAVP